MPATVASALGAPDALALDAELGGVMVSPMQAQFKTGAWVAALGSVAVANPNMENVML